VSLPILVNKPVEPVEKNESRNDSPRENLHLLASPWHTVFSAACAGALRILGDDSRGACAGRAWAEPADDVPANDIF